MDVLCAPNTFEPRFVDVTYGEKVRSSLNPADDIQADLNVVPGRDDDDEGGVFETGGGDEGDGDSRRWWENYRRVGRGRRGEESGLRYSVRQFEFKESERETVGRWHDNVEPFVAFYIDAASKIDKSDGRWLWFVLIAQKKDNLKRWATCGFSTVSVLRASFSTKVED